LNSISRKIKKSFEKEKGKNGKFNRVIVPLGQPTLLLSKEIKKTHFYSFSFLEKCFGVFLFFEILREPLQVLRTLTLFSSPSNGPMTLHTHILPIYFLVSFCNQTKNFILAFPSASPSPEIPK
jgi:hypothetical protein